MPRIALGDYLVVTGTWGGEAVGPDRAIDPVLRFQAAERGVPAPVSAAIEPTVALLGTLYVPAAEAGELWFEAGMAYDARRADDRAIDAFSKAIAGRPDDAGSKFQRGQIYLRRGDVANARRDLEDVARSPDVKLGPVKQLATQLLAQLGSKSAMPGRRAPLWDCRRRSSGTSIVCRPR